MTTASATAPYLDQIREEQVRVSFRQIPAMQLTNVIVGSAMVYGLWGVIDSTSLMIWIAALGSMIVIRTASWLLYRRYTTLDTWPVWASVYVFGTIVGGLAWGSAGLLLFHQEYLEYQLFTLFVLMGIGAGANNSLSAYLPALYAFLPLTLLPVGMVLITGSSTIHVALGVMTIAYTVGLCILARPINRTLIRSLQLNFENTDLVEELRQQRDEAERANISKSKFLAAASHDLRQPLHALTLFTAVLDSRTTETENRTIVNKINASVRALENLFDALLDISRLDAGVLEPEMRHFPLHPLVRRLLEDYTSQARAKGLELECVGEDEVVYSDQALLERILRNLLSNAIRYTHTGKVKVSWRRKDGQLRLEVSDTGIGIPESSQGEIFNEFHQLHNPERDRNKGLGLGLAIVDRVVQLLKLPVEVTSEPGKGSQFSITVPSGEADRITEVTQAAGKSTSKELEAMHVLVLDDEISVREGMAALLASWGCRVSVAATEEEAVAELRKSGTPNVILADYRLRGGQKGTDAIDNIHRAVGDSIPALTITGDTAPERLREAKSSGYNLLHKPVQPAMLRSFLRSLRYQTLEA